jgi:phage shock protein PspC (stress-responsive transcriptional regulator)
MCPPAPRTHAGAMNTNTLNPEDTTESERNTHPAPERALLRRSLDDRMLGGVAAGLARYFGVDPMIVRIAFVVLTVVGGAGIPLYLAGLLLIPDEGSDQSIAGAIVESLQSRSR